MLRQDSEWLPYSGERGKAVQILHEAEHLKADGGHDDEEAGCKHHQAAQFFTWTKYFVHKVLQGWGNLNQTHHAQHLKGKKKTKQTHNDLKDSSIFQNYYTKESRL